MFFNGCFKALFLQGFWCPLEQVGTLKHSQAMMFLCKNQVLGKFGNVTPGLHFDLILGMIAVFVRYPGPPVHFSINGIAIPSQRAALASFLCGDWFLGKYAKNYFARSLLPRTAAHLRAARDAGVEERMVCTACWHLRREAVLEDEFHVVCTCPQYSSARIELLKCFPQDFSLRTFDDICQILSSTEPRCLNALGRFLVRVRQTRRKMKCTFEQLNDQFNVRSFASKRAAWRLNRRVDMVCSSVVSRQVDASV